MTIEHSPSFDLPVVEATAAGLREAIRVIETERPEMYQRLLIRSGLLAAGAAKLMFDGLGGQRGGWIEYSALGVALARIALERPELGRLGLIRALTALVELVIMQTPEADAPRKVVEMTDWMAGVIFLFDGADR